LNQTNGPAGNIGNTLIREHGLHFFSQSVPKGCSKRPFPLPRLAFIWRTTLRNAGVRYFRLYDLRSTYATRLSAGGVADEWATQMLRQTDAQVFKRYSQRKLQMKREALQKLNRKASEPDSKIEF
jgi:integrase